MKITKLDKVLSTVDDVRSLTKTSSGMPISESIRELTMLLSNKLPWCLCGGLAVGVHSRPRGTDDIDILLLDDSYLFYVYSLTSGSFKKINDHLIEHKKTGVIVDLVTPEYINVNPVVIKKSMESAKQSVMAGISVPIVSRDGLVALKLNRGKYLDLADIESIIRSGGKVNLSEYPLTKEQIETLKKIEEEAK